MSTQVEDRKNRMNLRPNIEFVARHLDLYDAAKASILRRTPKDRSQAWADGIQIVGAENASDSCLQPLLVRGLLARMPPTLIALSQLNTVQYFPRVFIPGFDERGKLDPTGVVAVPVAEFPREGDHPLRILVGYSNGQDIFNTPIPSCVHENAVAVWLYQIHVFLHEFFHSCEYGRRGLGLREVVLRFGGLANFTLEEWFQQWVKLLLSGQEPQFISRYGATYQEELTAEVQANQPDKFVLAVWEQIAESFVAYQLGVVSNDEGWTNFQEESFGNFQRLEEYRAGGVESANVKWHLINRLCRATVVRV